MLASSSCRNPTPRLSANQAINVNKDAGVNMQIKLSSTAFQDNDLIPAKYTCDGDNVSPPLAWSLIPPNTKSIVLIVDDPDAPSKTWVHWVLYDVPASVTQLAEAINPQPSLPGGGKNGKNDFNKSGYGGPCPPSGTHRYFFKIYALDSETGLQPGATKEELLRAMDDHVIGQAQLVGKYQRR